MSRDRLQDGRDHGEPTEREDEENRPDRGATEQADDRPAELEEELLERRRRQDREGPAYPDGVRDSVDERVDRDDLSSNAKRVQTNGPPSSGNAVPSSEVRSA